jgi:CHAT domain-containing protein/Tfp pilus assembly protein PilF
MTLQLARRTNARFPRSLSVSRKSARLLFALLLIAQVSGVSSSLNARALHTSNYRITIQQQPASGLQEQDELLLELNKQMPYRTLVGGEVHAYRLRLEAQQYARVQGYFFGVDAGMTLYGPDGNKLEEVALPRSVTCQKSLMWVSKTAGEYRVEVRALDPKAGGGKYTMELPRLVLADEQNQSLILADESTAVGWRLHEVGTQEAQREAIEKFKEAIPRWRALGVTEQEYNSVMYLGEIYFNLSEYQNALETYEQALPLLNGGNRRGIFPVWTYNNFGRTYEMLGEPEKALRYFELSLQEAEKTGWPRDMAIAHTSLGAFHLSQGDKQKAFDYLTRAIPYWRKAFGEGPDVSGEARVLLRFGQLYASLGETEKAVDYFRQAAATWRSTSDPVWLVRALNGLGGTQHSSGDFEGALKTFVEALEVSRTSGSKENEAEALGNLGQVYLSLGEYERALEYLRQALRLTEETGNRSGRAVNLTRTGSAYYALGDRQKALSFYEQALPLREAVRDREGEAETLFRRAHVYRDLGDLAAARRDVESALGIVEGVRASFADQEMRASYLATVRAYYEFYIDLLMRSHERDPSAGFDAQALAASERARARSLLETLAEAGLDIHQGVDPRLVERERALAQRLSAKADFRTRLLNGPHTPEEEAAADGEVNALADDYAQVRAQLRKASPRYAALTQPQPLSLEELRRQVLDDGTVLLEYSLGEERSFLWAVTRDSIASYQLPRRAEIEEKSRRAYALLSAPAGTEKVTTPDRKLARELRGDADFTSASAALSRQLLGPVAGRLGGKRLLVVADGALQYLPFAALPDPEAGGDGSTSGRVAYRPLILKHEVVTLPSASTLAVLRREVAGRSPAPGAVAALADPVFEPDDPRVKRNSVRDKAGMSEGERALPSDFTFGLSLRDTAAAGSSGIPRLPSTRREAMAITSFVPPGQRLLALDFEASRAEALSPLLGRYRIVHIATHGLLDTQRPELSGIILSLVDQAGRRQDGFLRAHEIYNLRLPADLVVLSACETALGRDVKGEGLLGVTRGFMYAGAARVVSSLWKVDSAATAELMTRFYRKMLREGRTPGEALREGQVSMLEERRWQSPYYWAAFVLQGEYH